MDAAIAEIHDYWFGEIADDTTVEDRGALWFGGGDDVDAEIQHRFERLVLAAEAGELEHWGESARGRLALIILLDQFPLNIYRGQARAYDFEAAAVEHCLAGLAAGQDSELSIVERGFFYMPLMHIEDLALQERCVALFAAMHDTAPEARRQGVQLSLDFAREHRDIVARFGRFPHRNRVLGRAPAAEEEAWLAAGGATYGQ